jgi:hypothetical protein
VASSWFNQTAQETYVLYESERPNLWCWLLGIRNYDLGTGIEEQLSLRVPDAVDQSARMSADKFDHLDRKEPGPEAARRILERLIRELEH